MNLIWATISIAVLIIWVITIFDLFRHHLGASRTALWLLLIIILPFVGAVIYWSVRKPDPGEAEREAEGIAARREEAREQPLI